ncbi:MAG: hypothetical protein JWR32_2791 [Mycobacterium sp.]|jgi:cytoskeletal protein RodZ|nr:hypothetical protein [Mycobacterium sp.]MDT5233666.1 hypothetical protein [Mycobacterium sp.]
MSDYPERPDYYSDSARAYSQEPTQAAPYRDHTDDYPGAPAPPPEPPPRRPWYRGGPALVAAGALGAVVLAALIFGVVKLATGLSHTSTTTPTPSTATTPASSTAAPPTHPGRGGGGTTVITQGPQTSTVTDTPTATDTGTPAAPSTDTGTPTAPSTDASTPAAPSTSTLTQTVTVPPRLPFVPRPGG